jgi:uncharacterized membrane protein
LRRANKLRRGSLFTRQHWRALPALALALLCAACARDEPAAPGEAAAPPAPGAASTEDGPAAFRAIGQEPGWILDIGPGEQMVFRYDYGQERVVTPVPEPEQTAAGGTVYQASTEVHDLRVEIRDEACEDAMSGRPYPATVRVTLNRATYTGCGEPLPAAACSGELRVAGNRLFIPVEINGERTEALLDSGAEMTLVDAAFAERISLGHSGSEIARGTGGEQEVSFAEGVDIGAIGVELENRTVAVLDLSDIAERLIGEALPVVIGRELFDAGRLYVDIEGGRICTATDTRVPAGERLPLVPHAGIMQIPVSIAGVPAHADFDLGNGNEVLVGQAFAEKNDLLAPERIAGTKPGGGIGGEVTRKLVRLDSLELAGVSFPAVIAAVDDSATAAEANIGVDILRNFRMTIDFPAQAVWLEPVGAAASRDLDKH